MLWKYAVTRNNGLWWHIGGGAAGALLIVLFDGIGVSLPGPTEDITHTAFLWVFVTQCAFEILQWLHELPEVENIYTVDIGDNMRPIERFTLDTFADTIGAALGAILVLSLFV